MKFLKPVLIIALLGSLGLNALLYRKQANKRMQMKVGSRIVTKADWDGFLEDRYGTEALASIARQEIVKQAAAAAGVAADNAEIEEQLQFIKETDPQKSLMFSRLPHMEFDAKNELTTAINLANLRAKEVQASDEEIKDYFNANPGKWDKPDKIRCKVFQISAAAPDLANRAKELMTKINDMLVIQQQLDAKGTSARMAGADGSVTIPRPLQGPGLNNPLIKELSSMKPGEVKIFPAKQGITVLKLEKIDPGKKVTFEEVKSKVAREFKLSRAMPADEVLRKLWDTADTTFDNPDMKKQLTWVMFRDPVEKK
jgi:hypothetical protein